jgi:peptide-methionine (S)-S-oxide reductase
VPPLPFSVARPANSQVDRSEAPGYSKNETSKAEVYLMTMEKTAVFGGGCFWCIEAVFNRMAGVSKAVSGYMGGRVENPTYKQVCNGNTGHVEVVQVAFDPEKVTYTELLDVFFTVHDPTTLNSQGNDVGEQYRSVIFYVDDDQKREAEKKVADLNRSGKFRGPIVTAVEPASKFYVAEDYHQEYFDNNRMQPYCMFVVAPKVEKFEKLFAEKVQS